MIRRIALHEWRLVAREGSVWLLLGVFAAAIGYGTFNGVRWTRFQRAALEEAAREEQERFRQHQATIARLEAGELTLSPFADPRNPQTAGSRTGARYAAMPPAPLAPLSIGQSDLLPSYFKITSDARENVTAGAELENPHRLLTGRFDLAFVLIYLYPLLVLAMTYNVLSAEKEQGTLALTLSQPVSLRTLLIGKLSLRFAVFVVAITGLSAVALLVAGVDLAAPGAAARLLLWAATVVAYGLVWFALATLVASFGRASSTNAMILAAVWLAFVIVLPSLLNLLASAAYPVPSRVEMIQAMRNASDSANQQGSRLLSRYYEDHPELAAGGGAERAMTDFNIVRVAVNAEVASRVQPVIARYEAQLDGQRQLVSRARVLSPAILMQDALNDIAGTGPERHRRFLDQVLRFHETWQAYFVPLIMRKQMIERYDALPAFAFVDEPLASSANRVLMSIGFLLATALLIAGVSMARLRHYPLT